MNIFAVIILATLAIDFILNLVSDYLNLKSLDEGLPGEFQDVYDEETYEKSQRYTKERTKFGIFTSIFNLALLLVFWFAGGFQWLDEIVRSWELGLIWTGLAYIGILIFAKQILSLPFSIYSTFVIEEKYGFNKTTPKTFVLDLAKGLGLSVALGGPLLAGILAFFTFIDLYAWLYAWGAVTIFTLFIQFIAPKWIMPIFNDFEPLDQDSELRQKIRDYADKVNFAMEGVYVMDGSKRSSKSNAFFTGFGKTKRIALYDTLIDNHEEDELVAVLAHEIGHYKKKHIIKNMAISIAQTGIMFFLLSIFLNSEGLYEAFYIQQMSVYAGLIFFGMLYAPIDMIVSVFMQILSRKYEFEADEFASTTYKKEPMIAALKKLSKDNLSNLTPHPFYVFLNYSHPPVLERIKAIRGNQSPSTTVKTS